jgi:hypothetical protein
VGADLLQADLMQNKYIGGTKTMSDTQPQVVAVKEDPRKRQLQDVEAVRDLFARAHDYIAQASHPGHLSGKVAEVLNFLAFQYTDFKNRAENLAKQIKSEVDVAAAKAAADKALAPEAAVVPTSAPEVPKA